MARLLKCDPADDTEKATANEAGATADADTASTANKDEPKEGTRKTKKDPRLFELKPFVPFDLAKTAAARMAVWPALPAADCEPHHCARRLRQDHIVHGRSGGNGYLWEPLKRAANRAAAGVVPQRRGQSQRTVPPPWRDLSALSNSARRIARLVFYDQRQRSTAARRPRIQRSKNRSASH